MGADNQTFYIQGELIETGSTPGFEFASYRHGPHVLHRIKVVGPIGLKERIPLYHKTLALTPDDTYFCILDNSERHNNSFSFEDIRFLDQMLLDAGIATFYGATITLDAGYRDIVELANANVENVGLNGKLMTTHSPEEAETFIMEMLASTDGGK
ncbi:hypothetical protein [Nisaea nitritireducens]|uniref:hypothetical protein n=1 Tax=Nisaea nitritireducens TaxID=568392 RepID=UPI0018691264|nr:hypothetical protein [Nisaea nitritireducens]